MVLLSEAILVFPHWRGDDKTFRMNESTRDKDFPCFKICILTSRPASFHSYPPPHPIIRRNTPRQRGSRSFANESTNENVRAIEFFTERSFHSIDTTSINDIIYDTISYLGHYLVRLSSVIHGAFFGDRQMAQSFDEFLGFVLSEGKKEFNLKQIRSKCWKVLPSDY